MHVKSQQEFDAAVKAGDTDIVIVGGYIDVGGSISVSAWGNASVSAWGNASVSASDNASVSAWGNASVRAWGNASVRAWGNASVSASDNASVSASDNASVSAWGNARVSAKAHVCVRLFGAKSIIAALSVAILAHCEPTMVTGGQIIRMKQPETVPDWCEFYGVEVVNGIATLFKAVGNDFKSSRGGNYTPGSLPVADDWDGGEVECGHGLHFSPTPFMALEFAPDAQKFVACGVAVADIAIHPNGDYPNKCKAPRVVGACYEVDIDGKRIGSAT